MQTYIDKGELAVTYVIQTREKYANICNQIQLSETTYNYSTYCNLGYGGTELLGSF